jgi:hypothetical protein
LKVKEETVKTLILLLLSRVLLQTGVFLITEKNESKFFRNIVNFIPHFHHFIFIYFIHSYIHFVYSFIFFFYSENWVMNFKTINKFKDLPIEYLTNLLFAYLPNTSDSHQPSSF